MTTKIRETLAYMRKHGVPAGPSGPHGQRCISVTLCEQYGIKYLRHYSGQQDWKSDMAVIAEVLQEQYPEFGREIVKFSDTMGAQGRDEEVFRVLEKAAIRQEERL